MAAGNVFYLSFVVGITLIIGACSDNPDKRNDQNSGQSGWTKTADVDLISFIKKQKLANFQSATIGNAFDSYRYLTKKEWKGEFLKSGHFTADFIGWFEKETLSDKDRRDGVTDKALEVKFVIDPSGTFYLFMISVLEVRSDGKIYRSQLSNTAAVLNNIYANRKIDL